MASLITALDTAVSGLRVAQLQVQTAANNIANASDENYTRKTALQAPVILADGGGGVQIIGYQRAINSALNKTYVESISTNAFNGTANDIFSNIKDLYGVSSDAVRLSSSLNDFIGAWQSLAAAPEDSVRQREVLTAGDSFATEMRRIISQLDLLERKVQQEQDDALDDMNQILRRIDTLNNEVAASRALNQPSGNLEDQRDAAVRELAQYTSVRQLEADQGRIRLITPNGFVLLDVEPVEFTLNGNDYETVGGTSVNDILTGGSLQAMRNFRVDNSPSVPSTDPATEVFRKLRSQLDLLASSFLSTTGTPTTFAAAYNSGTAQSGELATGFFTGTDASDIVVNSSLLAGTATIKQGSANSVVASLIDNTRSFSADGLTANGTSYEGYNSTMLGLLGSAASTINGRAELSQTTMDTYKERFANVVGVNVDEELVSLTRFQNSYAAVARVLSVVREMLDTLETIV